MKCFIYPTAPNKGYSKGILATIKSIFRAGYKAEQICMCPSTFQYWIKTCENAVKSLWTVQFHMFFTPFSQGVKLLRPCEQGIFHKVRTHAKPCEKPCEFFPSEETCERRCEKPLKNLWPFSVFHMVENVKTCEQGIFHRVRTHAKPCEKPCEFFSSEKTCERPCEKPLKNLWTSSVFHMVENVKTCEHFTGFCMGSDPVKNLVSFYPVKTLWTFTVFFTG